MVKFRRAAQIVNETAREDVGVNPRFSPFEVEQDVGDTRIINPLAAARAAVGGILPRGDAGSLRVGSAVRHCIDRRAADVCILTQRVGVDGNKQRRVGGTGDLDPIFEIHVLVALRVIATR